MQVGALPFVAMILAERHGAIERDDWTEASELADRARRGPQWASMTTGQKHGLRDCGAGSTAAPLIEPASTSRRLAPAAAHLRSP
jgi:hypothetical protein